MKVITAIYLFYIINALQQAQNFACSLFFYHGGNEFVNWSILITALYFTSGILYAFPSFYKSIIIGLSSQLYASIINIFTILIDGLQMEKLEHIHIQYMLNMIIDIFKYATGISIVAFIHDKYDYYSLEI